jgi:adenylyltransferase/sulfurtransferase
VLGVLPGLLGVVQATEVIKLILGSGETLAGRLLLVDALSMRFREVKVRKNPECPVCGENPTVRELIDYEEFCGVRGEERAGTTSVPEIQPEELKQQLAAGEDIVLLDVREPHERAISRLPGHFIPLGDLRERAHELDSSREIVVYCKLGARSAKAVEFLHSIGFRRVRNLAGGINAWAERIDPTLPRY